MNAPRAGAAGATRNCPHCQETILESAAVCPACKHHLRFDGAAAITPDPDTITPLKVDGSIRNPTAGSAWEYSMVLTIRDERGQEIARRLIGVGALQGDEQRTFSLSVEMVQVSAGGKRTRH